MKQRMISLFLALTMLLSLVIVPTSAAEAVGSGMYGIKSESMSAVLTPQLEDNTPVKGESATINGAAQTYYRDAVRFELSFLGEANRDYFVSVYAGENKGGFLDAVYMNQYTADGNGRVVCTGKNAPYPSALEEGIYSVFANNTKIASFRYHKSAAVTSEASVTFRVVNGTWSDGSQGEKTVKVILTDGKGTLSVSQVPQGMKPNAGYEGGKWDVIPVTAENGITGNVTYTYTFIKRIPVTGEAAVTFRVANGTWSDGSKADKTVKVTLTDGKGTLPASQVPQGMKPNAGYEGGKWDVTPVTSENGITGNVTYTYTFIKRIPVTGEAAVTFRVANGTWSDGSQGEKTVKVTLTDGKGTLSASQVPLGMKPNAGYEGGKWDVTPVTSENGITGDVTYTYTFTKHVPVLGEAAVTFRVVNGTWSDGNKGEKTVKVTLTDGKGTLSAAQVPQGMKPNAGYEGGKWDVTPVTSQNGITGNVTYTYSFTEKTAPTFVDVKPTDWFYQGVQYTTIRGLFKGVSPTEFGPKISMTRSMVVQVLYSMAGKPKVEKTNQFVDVKDSDWFSDAVAWAVETGVSSGYPGGRFAPDDKVNREQLAVMLHGYMNKPAATQPLTFADNNDISGWARNAVQWAVENHIMGGVPGNKILPKGLAERSQGAVIMMNFDQLPK